MISYDQFLKVIKGLVFKDRAASEQSQSVILENLKLEAELQGKEKEIKALRHRIWKLKGLNYAAFREQMAYRSYVDKVLINIGSGSFYHPQWTNLDEFGRIK